MKKQTALALLGGDIPSAAQALGVTPRALYKLPEQLPRSMADRVLAARLRLEWHVALKQGIGHADLTELIEDALSV